MGYCCCVWTYCVSVGVATYACVVAVVVERMTGRDGDGEENKTWAQHW